MFGRENWARRAAELDSTDPKKQKKFEDKRTILESMRRHRGRTLVGSLVLSTLLNFGSLGKLGGLEGNWVKDRYAKRVKTDGRSESDPLIKIEDSKDKVAKEQQDKKIEKNNEFVSVEDAEENPDALIKVDKDNPLEGLEDLSLEDRARVDIATFDLRREYHMGELSLADLEDREKTFDEVIDEFIERSKKDDSDKIDFGKLLKEVTSPTLPGFVGSKYDKDANRLSSVFNKNDSRANCEGSMLAQLSVLQRIFNYDKILQNDFELYVGMRSADEEGNTHAVSLVYIKNTEKWLVLERNSVRVLSDEDRKYIEAYPFSSLVSSALKEKEKGVLHLEDEKEITEKVVKKFNFKEDDIIPAITHVELDTDLPVYPTVIDSDKIIEYKSNEGVDINSLPKEVENIVSKEVILQPKVEKFLKQISKLKTSLTNATNDEVRTSLESDIYEVVVSSDPDVLEKAVEKDPYIMIVYLQRELKIVSSAYNITLKQKISQDTPNIELEERPKSIAIPERKENESDKSFEKRLASYFQLLNDQMKLYFIRAKSELSTEIEKNNIIIDDLEDLSKYPDLLKILQRYEKNGTLDILTFWTDQFPNYIIDIGNILYLYHIFTLEEFVKNWKKNIASVDKSNIEDFYLKQQELADLYLGQRKIEKAQKIYEELIQSGYDSLGEISYSLAECYIYKHDYNPMIENYKRSALLGNIKAKERLLGFYIETNSNIDHKLLLRSLEELLRHEKKEFENENVSTLEAKNKLLKSYLRTLNVLGREIPDDVVEALNDINARALHIEFLDREQLLPIVRDNSLVLGQIYFDRKEYFDSIDNYMVAAKLEQGERIDSHLFEICDNVDKKFREVDVAYAKSNLGSLSSDIVYKLKDSDSNKGLTDEQKFEIVTKYFYVWKHISDVEFPDESFFDALVGLYAHNYKDKHDLLDKMMSFVKSEVTKLINKEESKK